jgi:5'-phosphate synthase pdxT subunit
MEPLIIGVLALQGAFEKHKQMLQSQGINVIEVRRPEELLKCSGLIIPGGESTAIMSQIKYAHLAKGLESFSKNKPIFGTCAGLILMAREIISDPQMVPFGWLDIAVERNVYGRQADSFRQEIELQLNPRQRKKFSAFFIRAPGIKRVGPDVQVLATFEDEPVLIREGHHLGAAFHPELTEDPTIHAYFIQMVKRMS